MVLMESPINVRVRAFCKVEANVNAYESDVFVSKDRVCIGFNGGSDRKVFVDVIGRDNVRDFCSSLVKAIKDEEVLDD